MNIERFKKYKAKVVYQISDDLIDPAPKNGSIIIVEAYWIQEKGCAYEGEWVFMPTNREHFLWIPQSDLELIEEVKTND